MNIYSIQGMSCTGCARAIETALNANPEVISVVVSFADSTAQVSTTEQFSSAEIITAIEALDYKVQLLTSEGDKAARGDDPAGLHIVIIGSGSAAFSCAIKAAENAAQVTIVEASETIGGCCVNVGCVPSKILIRAAHLAHQQRNNPFAGLENREPLLDRALLARQQQSRVDELRAAKYQHILDTNPALNLLRGRAQLAASGGVIVTDSEGAERHIVADKILIATGSTPTIPAIPGLDQTPYWTSTEALFATKLPEQLLVLGSSVVALEIAQAYRRLGSKVTIVARHTLLYSQDPELGSQLAGCFRSEGIDILTNTQALSISHDGRQFAMQTDKQLLHADKLLISTGRQANTENLNLAALGVSTDSAGAVLVNREMQTSNANIYAAGDCANMPQYVYVAAAAGSRAAVNMTGGEAQLDLSTMPAVIFTDPQVATVGLTEQRAKELQIVTDSRTLSLENVPRALANFQTAGFVKLVSDAQTGRLLGAQILADGAAEMIQSAVLAIANEMTVTQLANLLFPYLTMVEGIKLCAQTFSKDVSELSCCAG
ncbi:MAG: mercury(II) reductase [Pseudomonadales bacterium]|nr:mercury(II) reductase [Pseudomonadales bacterium]NRA17785.1 mercury(II) reductase [Oceanospirillaceae bacterium]